MDIKIRQYAEEDVKETIAIWNEVVKEGIAFPQKETLTESTGDLFVRLGTIPKGFEMNDGHYEDIIPHYHEL